MANLDESEERMTSLTDYLTFAVVFAAVFALVQSVTILLVMAIVSSRKDPPREPQPKIVYRNKPGRKKEAK